MGNCNSSSKQNVNDDDNRTGRSSSKKSDEKKSGRNNKKVASPNKSKQYPPKTVSKQPKDVGNDTQQLPSRKYAMKLSSDPTESSTADADIASSSVVTMPLSPLSPSSTSDNPLPLSPLMVVTNDLTTSRTDLLGSHRTVEQKPDFTINSNPSSEPTSVTYRSMAVDEFNDRMRTQQQTGLRRKHQKKATRYSNGHHPAGRALQGRLQRAQKMQHVLSGADSYNTNNSSTVDHASSGEEESSSVASSLMNRKYQRTLSSKYSTMSNASVDGSINSGLSVNQDEIETTLSKAAVWAEINLDDPVLCTCISRTKASLSKAAPPIQIAVGTSSGLIHIQELLNCDELQLTTTPTSNGLQADDGADDGIIVGVDLSSSNKLGKCHQLRIPGKVRSMDFSTNGKYLAVGGDSGICTVYRLDYVSMKQEPTNGGTRQQQVVDEDEVLVNIEMVAEVHRIDRIYAVQFSPDGSYLAIGGFDGAVAIIAVKELASLDDMPNSNKSPYQIEPVTEIVRDGLILTIDWSPDSRYLAIGGSDKCCAIVNTSASWKVFKEIRRATSVQSVQWYPGSGRYLAIGSCDVAIVVGRDSFTTITEIDVRDDDRNTAPDISPTHYDRQRTSNAQRSVFRTNAVCWSPNGSYFVICGSNNKCTIVETQSFSTVHEIFREGNITCAVWQQQSQIVAGVPRRYLAIGAEDNRVVIMKAGIEINPGTSSMADDYSNSAASSYFSPRGDWVLKEDAFSDMENIMEVPTVDRKGKSPVKTMSVVVEQTGPIPNSKSNSTESNGTIFVAIFSKGSKTKPSMYFAYAADNGLVSIRLVEDWRLIAEIQFPQAIQSMAFSNGSSNRYLALGGVDSNVYVSDTTNNFSIIARIVLTAPVTSVTFCKNNERLAAGSQDGTFALLDPSKSFEYCGEIEVRNNHDIDEDDDNESSLPPAPAVLSVDWCSKNMAIGRDDGTVAVYDYKQVLDEVYEPVMTIRRKAAVHSVSFGVSSRFLAVAGADNTIGIYSAKGSWVLCHQVQMSNTVTTVRWSPVGRYLACGSADGTIKVIDTIFWADVEEAAEAVPVSSVAIPPGRHNGNKHRNPIQALSFSQDGKLLAVARPDIGTIVLNTTTNWAVNFRLPVEKSIISSNTEMNDYIHQGSDQLEASSLSSYEDDQHQRRPPQSPPSNHRQNQPQYNNTSHSNISFSEDDYYPPSSYVNLPCEV
jgi:WD40 repeat protein